MVRASFYAGQEKFDLALADCNKAFEINPKEANVFRVKELIYNMKGNDKKASEYRQKAAQLPADSTANSILLHLRITLQLLSISEDKEAFEL